MSMGSFFDAGSDILNAVSDAVSNADFSGLKDSITDSVKRAMGTGGDRKQRTAPKKNYFLTTRPQRNRGSFKEVMGKIGSIGNIALSAFSLIGALMLALAGTTAMAAGFVMTGVFAAAAWGFHSLSAKGRRDNELVSDYYRYGEIIGPGREYFAIEDLANRAGETKEEVLRNITDMKKDGMLPYAMIDDKKTTVMLTDNAWMQYKRAEMAWKQRMEEERIRNLKSGVREDSHTASGSAGSGSAATAAPRTEKEKEAAETAKILDEGSAYIRRIREVNDLIPDTEEMSDKLYRLENIVKRIFDEVRQHPEKAKSIRKLMSYYLPTTDKLLDAYVKLDRQSPATENIRKTKKEIEDSMDVITEGYEQLFDSLFQEEAWDISSDINVMKTMMAQDGLTKDGLKKEEEKEKVKASAGPDEEEGPSGLHFG